MRFVVQILAVTSCALSTGCSARATATGSVGAIDAETALAADTVSACPKPCIADAPCMEAYCDDGTGLCMSKPLADGSTCPSSEATCWAIGMCNAGQCAASPEACDDGNACTDDTCMAPGKCISLPNQATCEDGLACTQNSCDAGSCQFQAKECGLHAICVEPIGCECEAYVAVTAGSCQCAYAMVPTDVDGLLMCVPDFPVGPLGPVTPTGLVPHADGTVAHAQTGLVWQLSNKGAGPLDWWGAVSHCGKLTLGGHNDWRLPTTAELLSIVDQSATNWPTGDGPFDIDDGLWTSTSVAPEPTLAWLLWNFSLSGWEKDAKKFGAVCVRAGKPFFALPARWSFPAPGTVLEAYTGLTWQRSSSKQQFTWTKAKSICSENQFGLPGTGWRLPNIRELQSLLDRHNSTSVVDAAVFPSTSPGPYWSSTASGFIPDEESCVVGFGSGLIYDLLIDPIGDPPENVYTAHVRCVRSLAE